MKKLFITVTVIFVILMVNTSSIFAQRSKLLREVIELLIKEVPEESVKRKISSELVEIQSKYGDNVLNIIRQSDQKQALRLLDDFGENAGILLSKKSRVEIYEEYGKEAGKVIIDHPYVGEKMILEYQELGVSSMKRLSRDNGIRLLNLIKNKEVLQDRSNVKELLRIVKKYGNRVIDFLWQAPVYVGKYKFYRDFINDPESAMNKE